MSELIALQCIDGQVLFVPEPYIIENKHHFLLKYNKRGHLRRAFEKPRNSKSPLSNNGTVFEQALESGRVYALRGVLGSERPQPAETP